MEHFRRRGGPHDPITNLELTDGFLTPDWRRRQEVEAFLQAHEGYIPRGWPASFRVDRVVPAPLLASQWNRALHVPRKARSAYPG
ncbi:unnamed protein product [Polarella glacialis]|uniref:Uncharacterized protein n=1 Tax=Polarella glacialis TaxID=89957 RepID=A0A813GWH4_POLGL|nr:unnamed protein product [Polarella glacialis]